MVKRTAPAPAPGRPERPRRGMCARVTSVAGRNSAFGFTVRLCAAVAATFALLGIAGYVMIGHQLQSHLLETYAAEHRADARSFADAQLRAHDAFAAHRQI